MTKLTVKLSKQASKELEELRNLGVNMRPAVLKALKESNDLAITRIKRQYLSRRGPKSLGVISDTLRGSVDATRPVVAEDGRFFTNIGTLVEYAAVHEFGFKGNFNIPAHTRDNKNGTTSSVKAHKRKVNFPARMMFQQGINDQLNDYSERLSKAILGVARGTA